MPPRSSDARAGDDDPAAAGASSTDGDGTQERSDRPASESVGRPGVLCSEPTVFVLDEAGRAELFEYWLAEDYRVVTAQTAAEAETVFDDRVAVAMVRNEADEDCKEAVERLVASRSPFARTIVTTTGRVEAAFPGIEYDVCLVEPTTESGVRETVDRLSRRAQYQALLKRYYEVTAFVTNREVTKTKEELEDDETYQRATRALETHRTQLNTLQSGFDADDHDAVLQSLRPDDDLGPSADDAGSGSSEKHRPDRCVNCDVEWTDDPGATAAYERLGAFVWKCRECNAVQNLPDPSHRRLARR